MKTYFNHRRAIDFTIAIFVALAVHYQPLEGLSIFRWPISTSFETLMLAISASSATMVGFVLAASTFLITHTGHERFAVLRASAGYAQLLEIVRSNMWRLILLTALAGAGAIVNTNHQREALVLLSFFLTLGFCGIATLIWCTLSILAVRVE